MIVSDSPVYVLDQGETIASHTDDFETVLRNWADVKCFASSIICNTVRNSMYMISINTLWLNLTFSEHIDARNLVCVR